MDSLTLAENIVIYDWLSFTSKIYTQDEIIECLGLYPLPWEVVKGARGYQDRLYYGGISVHYNGRPDMGVWFEASGQGCRTLETYSVLDWPAILAFAAEGHITRLDVAYDDHVGLLDMVELIDDTRLGNWVSRSNVWETICGSVGDSLRIGSPKSDILIRIYDKAAERKRVDEHWIRVELQLRDQRAAAFAGLKYPIGEAFAGVLLNYLRYVIPEADDTNRWRWPMRDYWLNLVADVERIKLYKSPGVDYNIIRCEDFVYRQAGNAISALIECYGSSELLCRLRSEKRAYNPKYERMVNEYRLDMLAKQIGEVFGYANAN